MTVWKFNHPHQVYRINIDQSFEGFVIVSQLPNLEGNWGAEVIQVHPVGVRQVVPGAFKTEELAYESAIAYIRGQIIQPWSKDLPLIPGYYWAYHEGLTSPQLMVVSPNPLGLSYNSIVGKLSADELLDCEWQAIPTHDIFHPRLGKGPQFREYKLTTGLTIPIRWLKKVVIDEVEFTADEGEILAVIAAEDVQNILPGLPQYLVSTQLFNAKESVVKALGNCQVLLSSVSFVVIKTYE